MLKLILADNQAIFRAGIAKVLAVEDEMRIVAQAQTQEQMFMALDEIRLKPAGNHQYGGAEFIQGHEHLFLGLGLRHNAHFVFYCQYFGDSRAKNCLVIGQN